MPKSRKSRKLRRSRKLQKSRKGSQKERLFDRRQRGGLGRIPSPAIVSIPLGEDGHSMLVGVEEAEKILAARE